MNTVQLSESKYKRQYVTPWKLTGNEGGWSRRVQKFPPRYTPDLIRIIQNGFTYHDLGGKIATMKQTKHFTGSNNSAAQAAAATRPFFEPASA